MQVEQTDRGLLAARLASPTGILPHELRALRHAEKVTLAAWHRTVAGDANGREWLPAAIRALGPAAQLALAEDDETFDLWVQRERLDVLDVAYFTWAYGSIKNDDEEEPGPPIPFDLWPAQERVLDLMRDELRLVILKARQLGLTWLALHYAVHLIAIDPAGRDATVLGLSQDGGYAKRLLERARELYARLPPFLKVREHPDTTGSKSEFRLLDRGRMISLPGTPASPRSYQADLAICDEWAFVRNGQAGPTMTALLPNARKIIAISSGQGGPDEPGKPSKAGKAGSAADGKHFASLYVGGREDTNGWTAVFLPTSTHPDRTPAWRAAKREEFDTEEEFLAEHPETDDEALIGAGRDRYFKLGDIAAAVRLGAELDALLGTDKMPPPSNETIRVCLDYGDVVTQGYTVWPLAGGGVYVPPSEVQLAKSEPDEIAQALHERAMEVQTVTPNGYVDPPIERLFFDNAGAQVNRGVMAVVRAKFAHLYEHKTPRSHGVQFRSHKRETATFMRRLFKRTGEGRAAGVIAISPQNTELIRQLRGLESAPDALWKKDDDHGPDALVAGIADIARRHRELTDKKE